MSLSVFETELRASDGWIPSFMFVLQFAVCTGPFHLHDLESDVSLESERCLILLSLRGKRCHLTSRSSSCWNDESCACRLLFISSNHPSVWYCHTVFLCGRASVHPFLLAPFGKLIHFLLKCLNNYSDIEVNCLISIAMEASPLKSPHNLFQKQQPEDPLLPEGMLWPKWSFFPFFLPFFFKKTSSM